MSEHNNFASNTSAPVVILRRKDVEQKTGLARSTIYARVQQGTFPPPVQLGSRHSVGWIAEEIDVWLRAQITSSRNEG